MFAALQKLFSWLFGHAIIDGVSDAFKDKGKKTAEDIMAGLTRKDLLLGVIFSRLGTITKKLTKEEVAEGIRRFNEFYASLATREERDLFERLFYRDVLDAIQEYLRSRVHTIGGKDKDGKVTSTTTKPEDQRIMHQQYIAVVGLSGPEEIRLEMERLFQMSPMTKIKNAFEGTGDNTSRLLNAFINGLEGK